MKLSSVSHVPGAMKVKPKSSRVLFRDTRRDEAHWKGESGCVHPKNPKQGSLLMSFLVEAVRGNIDLSYSIIEMSFACVSPLPLLHRTPLNSSHSASSALHSTRYVNPLNPHQQPWFARLPCTIECLPGCGPRPRDGGRSSFYLTCQQFRHLCFPVFYWWWQHWGLGGSVGSLSPL